MKEKEKVLEILREIKPAGNLEGVTDLIEGGYIESFELMLLISRLEEEFSVEISVDEIAPENFNSAEAISEMIRRLAKEA